MTTEEGLFREFSSPGEALRAMLEENNWTQEEFAIIAGVSRQTIAQIASNRSGVTPEMARAFGVALKTSPAYWMKLDSEYRLSQAKNIAAEEIGRRAMVYGLAPVRDMQKRGWIRDTKNIAEIESDLCSFFGTDALTNIPPITLATRRSGDTDKPLSPAQRAWGFRARTIAKAVPANAFDNNPSSMSKLSLELRKLAAYPKEARHLPSLLAQHGIRFVVVEPLPGSKIDGSAFWLSSTAPVIAVSVRFDRIDNFWFTVMHEFSHVRNGDALSIDVDIEGDGIDINSEKAFLCDLIEERANIEAAAYLIPRSELDSFIGRVGPLYSRDKIVQFAHSTKIHPGIIVGQLQKREELHSSNYRDLLSKIRDTIIDTALTDGWGKSIAPGVLNE